MPGAPYTIVLTHDVDRLSVGRAPLSRETLALAKALLVSNLGRWLAGRITARDYLASLAMLARLPLVWLRLVSDPWERSIELTTAMEEEFGARSTFFFMPFARRAGHRADGSPAPTTRAASYRLADHQGLLRSLVRRGWEVGVHGIDAHIDLASAQAELAELREILGHDCPIGLRMHWLYSSPSLRRNLRQAGYAYDATLGWNDRVGFPDGHYRPFADRDTGLTVVPLNIQDVALLRFDHMNLSPDRAWQHISALLDAAGGQHGVVTVLWHNDSFLPPRCWGGLYRRLLERARTDGARIASIVQLLADAEASSSLKSQPVSQSTISNLQSAVPLRLGNARAQNQKSGVCNLESPICNPKSTVQPAHAYTTEDIAEQLRALGIHEGDTVLARGSVRSIGTIFGPGRPREKVIRALLSALGAEGTLVGLAFTRTFLFPRKHREYVFDRHTPPTTGGFASAMVEWPGSVRSGHPSNSFVAIGRNAELILNGHDERAGCFSPIERLLELDGKMLAMGIPPENPGFSTVHLAQFHLGLSTRSIMANRLGVHFVRPDGSVGVFRKRDVPGCSRGFHKFYAHYVRQGKLEIGRVGDAYSLAIKAADAYRIERALLSRNPRFALCDNPGCVFCRGSLYYNLGDWPVYYLWRVPSILLAYGLQKPAKQPGCTKSVQSAA
jgi:aminoglycoside N3'-acetyltransferase